MPVGCEQRSGWRARCQGRVAKDVASEASRDWPWGTRAEGKCGFRIQSFRAATPAIQGRGLLLWVSSGSFAGGTPPYLAPYFAAKAGMDALAVQYARELTLWCIETSIIVPGAFTSGANHFAHSGAPADKSARPSMRGDRTKGRGKIQEAFAAIVPKDAGASKIAEAIVKLVNAPFGKRPFCVDIDPTQDGADVAFGVIDRVREEVLHRVGLDELLWPAES